MSDGLRCASRIINFNENEHEHPNYDLNDDNGNVV